MFVPTSCGEELITPERQNKGRTPSENWGQGAALKQSRRLQSPYLRTKKMEQGPDEAEREVSCFERRNLHRKCN
jgi:hypothetical protein